MITIPGVDPLMMWAGFLLLVFFMLALDLGVLNRKAHEISIKEALGWAAMWFSLAMIFNAWIYYEFGKGPALEFLTGYLIEKSLSVDNLFVFLVIFSAFNIPAIYQHRVLFWGILGAIITRGIFIALGVAIVDNFVWAFFIFGIVLLYAAYKMQFGEDKKFDPDKSWIVRVVQKFIPVSQANDQGFFTRVNGKLAITVLFLALIVIELTDVVFAFDSIPAIFAITTDPFIVFTSNIFAILGLRSLYFVLAGMQGMFEYLKSGLALILLFISFKLILKPFHLEVPLTISLIFIVTVLILSILLSLLCHKRVRAVAGAVPAGAAVEALPQHPAPLPADHALVLKEIPSVPALIPSKVAKIGKSKARAKKTAVVRKSAKKKKQ